MSNATDTEQLKMRIQQLEALVDAMADKSPTPSPPLPPSMPPPLPPIVITSSSCPFGPKSPVQCIVLCGMFIIVFATRTMANFPAEEATY